MTAKSDDVRKFYLLFSLKNNYSKRELERQIDSSLYERTMISSVFISKFFFGFNHFSLGNLNIAKTMSQYSPQLIQLRHRKQSDPCPSEFQ